MLKIKSSGKSFLFLKSNHAIPGYTNPNLWPETLIDLTCSNLKSHCKSGYTNGAINPPLAASTCIGIFQPFSSLIFNNSSLISWIESIWPVYVVPKTVPTHIVFSSTSSIISLAEIVYFSSSIGISLISTSKYNANFFHTVCASAPITIFGFEYDLPCAILSFFHVHLWASNANKIASDEPTVEVPVASSEFGELYKSDRIWTHILSILYVLGYSQIFIKFFPIFSIISLSA